MSNATLLRMLAAIALALPAAACAGSLATADPPRATSNTTMTTASKATSIDRPANGAYSGRIDHLHQHVSLQIRSDDTARLVILHNLHLPPSEVEVLDARLVERDGGWCLDPAPRTIGPCLSIEGDASALGVTHLASAMRIPLDAVDPVR